MEDVAYYNKIGLLVLSTDETEFLVCEKDPQNVTSDYIMPGGQFQEDTIEECLRSEIKEELNTEIDFSTVTFVGEYIDVAAGKPERNVSIKLYRGKLQGEPAPYTEIKALHWIGKKDMHNGKVSPIIRNKIIPDLIRKNILK